MSWGGPERYGEGDGTYFVGQNLTLPDGTVVPVVVHNERVVVATFLHLALLDESV